MVHISFHNGVPGRRPDAGAPVNRIVVVCGTRKTGEYEAYQAGLLTPGNEIYFAHSVESMQGLFLEPGYGILITHDRTDEQYEYLQHVLLISGIGFGDLKVY